MVRMDGMDGLTRWLPGLAVIRGLLNSPAEAVPVSPQPGVDASITTGTGLIPPELPTPGPLHKALVNPPNRREFLARAIAVCGLGVVGATLPGVDLEKLLWV